MMVRSVGAVLAQEYSRVLLGGQNLPRPLSCVHTVHNLSILTAVLVA